MCHRSLLLCGFLLLCLPGGWHTLADECIKLKLYATKVATCCDLELFLNITAHINCFDTMDAKYPDAPLDSAVCAIDCTYREMGILTGEDEINEEMISANHEVYDATYQEAIAKAVGACVAKKAKMLEEAAMFKTECNPFALKFHGCIALESMRHCPEERWDSSPLCEKVRAGATPCMV